MIRLSLAKRICYHYPYVMLAATLSDDPVDEEDTSSLRADADNEGICYIHVISSLGDGWYLVRVAARPEFLPKGYIMILSEGQLAYMLPWDCRLRGGHMTPDCIYKRLCAYRASHQPTRQRVTPAPGQPSGESQALETTTSADVLGTPAAPMAFERTLIKTRPLPHVFVTQADFQQAIERMELLQEIPGTGHRPVRCKACQRHWLERVMIRAALTVLERERSQERSEASLLLDRLQQAIRRVLTSLQRFHQHLTKLSMVFQGKQHIGWWVQVDLPVTLAL